MALRLALAAAVRARTAAIAVGRQRCSLPRQPLGAQHQALLGMGARAVTPPSLVPPFSTNAVEGEGEGAGRAAGGKDAAIAAGGKGASIAAGKASKTADADVAAEKTKAFDPLGFGKNAEAEDSAIAAAGKGASIAAGKAGCSKIADVDAAAQKAKAQAFDPLGSRNNAEAEDADIGLVEVGGGRNTVEGEGAAVAGGKGAAIVAGKSASSNGLFKARDADAAAHKTKPLAFDPLGTGNVAKAEESAGEVEMAVGAWDSTEQGEQLPGEVKEVKGGEGAGGSKEEKGAERAGVIKEQGGEGAGDILKEEKGGGKRARDIVKKEGGEGAGAIVKEEKGDEGAGDISCLYDEAHLRAFMESLLVDKCIVDVPLFAKSLELERTKHLAESDHSEKRHMVLMALGIILRFIVLAVLKYLQSAEMAKRVEEKKLKQEVVMVDKKTQEEEKEEEEDKQEEEGSSGGSLLLLVLLLFVI